MVDYTYYTTAFSGTYLTEEDFKKLEPRAYDYVKFYLCHNFKECDEVKMAICAVCEVYATFGEYDGVISESNDGISRTFDRQNISKCADGAIAKYLAGTNLLYRGI